MIAFGAAMLYFGKLIGDTKAEKYDKYSYYISGLFFILLFIIIPAGVVFWIIKNLNFLFPIWSAILLQIICLYFLSKTVTAHEVLRRWGLVEEFKDYFKKVAKKAKKSSFIGWAIQEEEAKFGAYYPQHALSLTYDFFIKKLSYPYLLLSFSFLTVFSFVSIIYQTTNPIYLAFSFTLTLLCLSNIALVYGYNSAHYPSIEVHLNNGKIIKGRLMRFDEFLYLINYKENKRIFVNKDKVVMIKERVPLKSGEGV